jgi:hypothetical protein
MARIDRLDVRAPRTHARAFIGYDRAPADLDLRRLSRMAFLAPDLQQIVCGT